VDDLNAASQLTLLLVPTAAASCFVSKRSAVLPSFLPFVFLSHGDVPTQHLASFAN